MWVDDLSNPTIAFMLCIGSERWWVRRKIPLVNLFQRVDRSLHYKSSIGRVELLFLGWIPQFCWLKKTLRDSCCLIPHFLLIWYSKCLNILKCGTCLLVEYHISSRFVIVSTTSVFASVICCLRYHAWVRLSELLQLEVVSGKSGHLHGFRSTIDMFDMCIYSINSQWLTIIYNSQWFNRYWLLTLILILIIPYILILIYQCLLTWYYQYQWLTINIYGSYHGFFKSISMVYINVYINGLV